MSFIQSAFAHDQKTADHSPYAPTFLDTKKLPKEFHDKFDGLPSYKRHNGIEKIFKGEKDKRTPYDTNRVDFCSRIGQVKVTFKDLKDEKNQALCGNGTATVFYINNNRAYAITCAHNLIHYHRLNKQIHKLNHCWFDRRITNKGWLYPSSNSIIRYNVDQTWIHPQYNPKDLANEYDVGIISFIDNDRFYSPSNKKTSIFNHITIGFYDNPEYSLFTKTFATVGGVAVGAGMGAVIVSTSLAAAPLAAAATVTASATTTAATGGTILAYANAFGAVGAAAVSEGLAVAAAPIITGVTATTTGAASGVATVKGVKNYWYCKFNGIAIIGFPGEKRGELWGCIVHSKKDVDSVYDKRCTRKRDGKMVSYRIHTTGGQSGSSVIKSTKGVIKIIGIHTGGNSRENYGVVMNEEKIEWINKCVLANAQEKDNESILQLF